MRDRNRPPAIDRALDGLASRAGVLAALIVLLTVSALAAVSVEEAVKAVEKDEQIFDARQARNGFVSLSDIQRLNLVLVDALAHGRVTPEIEDRFRRGIDILHVRAESFRRTLDPALWDPSAEQAILGLQELVAIGDEALSAGFPDLAGLSSNVTRLSDDIRGDLAIWNDGTRRIQRKLLGEKTRAIHTQQRVVWLSVAGLTGMGVGALLLLRREVLGRNARRRAEKRVQFLAYYDALTRLPNRPQFQDRVAKRLIAKKPTSLFFVDLDHFKGVNDTYGHAAGDATLRHVAGIIERHAIDAGGFAARLGGDEFAVVVPFVDERALAGMGRAMTEDVNRPFLFEQDGMQVSVSIGAASSGALNRQDLTLDTLARFTDFALYVSKEDGRNRCTVYDDDLKERYRVRRGMLDDLPRAISDGQLDVYFQPKVDLGSRAVYGFEAFVRWHHRGRVVPPGEFIGLAEESGLVVELDTYVLEKAATIVSDWNARTGDRFSVSVNLSGLNFSSPRIIGKVRRILSDTGLDPRLLTLEITETVELRDWDKVQNILAALRGLGCRIAVDDFGTGFSSMVYLRSIMADELKIDRTLVQEIDSSDGARFVFDTVLDLAANLKMDVVVEGIETEDQADVVASLGAVFAQGYLFGKPVPAREALARARDACGGRALGVSL